MAAVGIGRRTALSSLDALTHSCRSSAEVGSARRARANASLCMDRNKRVRKLVSHQHIVRRKRGQLVKSFSDVRMVYVDQPLSTLKPKLMTVVALLTWAVDLNSLISAQVECVSLNQRNA